MCDGSPWGKAQTPGMRVDEDMRSALSPAFPSLGPPDHSPKRRIWSASEDEQLVSLVDEHGDLRWSQIAGKMFKRNHKQVRLPASPCGTAARLFQCHRKPRTIYVLSCAVS
jgi:hypothetical protein